jgi:hypothetical protein
MITSPYHGKILVDLLKANDIEDTSKIGIGLLEIIAMGQLFRA